MSVHQSEDYGIPKEIVVVGMVGEAGAVTEEEEDMEEDPQAIIFILCFDCRTQGSKIVI
jgi:hypothetical protein